MKFCESLPKFEVRNEASKFSFNSENELDYNLPVHSSCNYYTAKEVQNLKTSTNLNIFHTNINGLESKFDNLHEFISNLSSDMDIIAITETSQKNDDFFTTNVSMNGYKEFYTPSNSSKGGTALYVKEKYEIFERIDLKIQNDFLESVWIEVKNKNKKNIVCGCIYRHPNHDTSEFSNYLESLLKNVSSENKEVYICGDFNIDLLKLDIINNYQQYYNLLCSFGFLPLIVQPTRVVENQTPSLIDNIFSNNLSDEIISGNIYLTLSEHFCQFASVTREKIDTRNISIYTRDYSKFSANDFIDDVSIQTWNYDLDNPRDLFNDFYWRLQGCVDRHAPIKKLKPKEIRLKTKPWITPDLCRTIKTKNKLFERKKDNQQMTM